MKGVEVDVTKFLETRPVGKGRMQVRGFSYCYNAHIAGKHNVLRYDNNHDFEDYHRHVFDINTGSEIKRIPIKRSELPTLAEFLDELEKLMG